METAINVLPVLTEKKRCNPPFFAVDFRFPDGYACWGEVDSIPLQVSANGLFPHANLFFRELVKNGRHAAEIVVIIQVELRQLYVNDCVSVSHIFWY